MHITAVTDVCSQQQLFPSHYLQCKWSTLLPPCIVAQVHTFYLIFLNLPVVYAYTGSGISFAEWSAAVYVAAELPVSPCTFVIINVFLSAPLYIIISIVSLCVVNCGTKQQCTELQNWRKEKALGTTAKIVRACCNLAWMKTKQAQLSSSVAQLLDRKNREWNCKMYVIPCIDMPKYVSLVLLSSVQC